MTEQKKLGDKRPEVIFLDIFSITHGLNGIMS